MRVTVGNLDLLGVHHVVKHMRHSDWIECINVVPRPLANVDGLAMLAYQNCHLGFLARVNDVPAVVFNAIEKHPGCWSIGMFATDDFALCWRRCVKEFRRVIAPALVDAGARYCEAHAHAGNVDAHRLLAFMGFKQRSDVLEGYGAYGEPFVLFTASTGDLPDVLRQGPERT